MPFLPKKIRVTLSDGQIREYDVLNGSEVDVTQVFTNGDSGWAIGNDSGWMPIFSTGKMYIVNTILKVWYSGGDVGLNFKKIEISRY